MKRQKNSRLASGLLLCSWLLGSCSDSDHNARLAAATDTTDPVVGTDTDVDTALALRPKSQPSEYVGLTVRKPVDRDGFFSLLDGLFATNGSFLTDYELQPGVLLSSTTDPTNPGQLVIRVEMLTSSDTVSPRRRILFQGPASFAYGGVFRQTADAALTTTAGDLENMYNWQLEYRIRTAEGGALNFGLTYNAEQRQFETVVNAQTTTTSLQPGKVNQPLRHGDPYESIYGLVGFTLSRDQFEFFSTRAYGITAGRNQNFTDFELVPHRWLRLTVTPELDQQLVNVGFALRPVGNDSGCAAPAAGQPACIPVSRAPASIAGGEQFRESVFRMVDNMNAAEASAPGSSADWQVPFYYDDPNGGGVVEVIARGHRGIFSIDYAVETPVNMLASVGAVTFQGTIDIPDDWDAPAPSCVELGTTQALSGVFKARFFASGTVRNSASLDNPALISGDVTGSIFRAEDVTVTGPKPGTTAAGSFRFNAVDVTPTTGSAQTFTIDADGGTLAAGKYQILGFMDTDNNADPGDPSPDINDPVMIPIGGFELSCAEQPINVEFALLLPAGAF